MSFAPWILLALTVGVFTLLIARELAEIRRAIKRVEAETFERDAEDGELDTEPEDVLAALAALADLPDVHSVHQERESNVIHVLAASHVSEARFQALKNVVRLATPIGLSSRVVRSRDEIPEKCVTVARGWAA